MSTGYQFDVFLAHNSQDKPLIWAIYHKLQSYGLKPWLDEEHIPPGTTFQDEIQEAISQVKSAAIFFGTSGLGRWQNYELQALFDQCVEREIPVIPVFLPGISQISSNLLFLKQVHAVTFKDGIEDEQALAKLYWGITRKKLEPKIEKPFDPSLIEDNLLSERAIDYSKLRDLLRAGKWKEADEETLKKIVECCSGKKVFLGLAFSVDADNLRSIPCADLQTIDRLWIKYSNARFGFSVQRKLYLDVHGKFPNKTYKSWDHSGVGGFSPFARRIGWMARDGSNWIKPFQFTAEVPRGNLPVFYDLLVCPRGYNIGKGYRSHGGYGELFLRLEDCKPWYLDLV